MRLNGGVGCGSMRVGVYIGLLLILDGGWML